MAERIQRKRVKGWRMPEGAVYVGRGTRWGNPWAVGDPVTLVSEREGHLWGHVRDREVAAKLFEVWMLSRHDFLRMAREELAGRDLACWCPLPQPGQPDHCHAAALLRIANPDLTEEKP